jgi:hypothetical protein
MAATIRLAFFIALLYVCLFQGSGAQRADQTCRNGYYCPLYGRCKYPRSSRCTPFQTCRGLGGCYKRHDGRYRIGVGHTTLTSSGLFKRWWWPFNNHRLEHQFLTYRGYTYEFGRKYSVQELDIADHIYKYKNSRQLKRITTAGYSYCSYDEVKTFTNGWKKSYSVLRNNCQHFVNGLKKYLKDSSCNRRPSWKRDASNITDILIDEANTILSDVCHCNSNGTVAATNGASAAIISIPLVVLTLVTALSIGA